MQDAYNLSSEEKREFERFRKTGLPQMASELKRTYLSVYNIAQVSTLISLLVSCALIRAIPPAILPVAYFPTQHFALFARYHLRMCVCPSQCFGWFMVFLTMLKIGTETDFDVENFRIETWGKVLRA